MHRESISGRVRARARAAMVVVGSLALPLSSGAQALLDPTLNATTVAGGLEQPIAMAFIGRDDILVTEKASGQVKRVTGGTVTGVVLDLAVNSSSERGLLGLALHPRFPRVPFVYLYNTESTTGADSNVVSEVPLLGNRVDRFVWNGRTLTFDRNLIRLRAFQNDRNNVADPTLPVLRGNHNGGVLRFGPDGKLYVIYGDNGRRGFLQNNLGGPVPDDAFGGPVPDAAHFTGVILRLDDDGGTPHDNPFFGIGRQGDAQEFAGRADAIARLGVEVRRNLERMFAYGVRNSFGMTFDPKTGTLWTTENGGRAFDEVNRVVPGFNGGWIQVMGPLSRVQEFKAIELAAGLGPNGPVGLQQLRYPATRIADTPEDAVGRLFRLRGFRLRDPEFSWKNVVPPAALGFVDGDGLGTQYDGDLIVGSAVARATNAGNLYRFRLNGRRTAFTFTDPGLQDKVADNLALDDFETEGAEILFGTGFGIITHIETGADGALYLVSPSAGSITRISKN
jgi:aldose sugar dehydrogenase